MEDSTRFGYCVVAASFVGFQFCFSAVSPRLSLALCPPYCALPPARRIEWDSRYRPSPGQDRAPGASREPRCPGSLGPNVKGCRGGDLSVRDIPALPPGACPLSTRCWSGASASTSSGTTRP